jgi:cold shock CspA family protein
LNGKIKKYIAYRGFGFIEVEDREDDVFFHISNYPRNMLPIIGQKVEFNLLDTHKGKEANDIQIIQIDEVKIPDKQTQNQDLISIEDENSNLETLVGVGPKYQELLLAVGVDSIEKLANENSIPLFNRIKEYNKGKRISKRLPTIENIEAWINLVKN